MSQAKREQLSALMDDELDRREIDTALVNLSGENNLRSTWDRYHLIGDAIRGEPLSLDVDKIAGQVRDALDDETPRGLPFSNPPRAPRHWFAPIAGSALAASVALVALVAWPGLFQSLPPDGGFPAATLVEQRTPETARYMDRSGTHWGGVVRPEIENKLNGYLVDHQEFAPAAGMRGMLPYTTFASYDVQR